MYDSNKLCDTHAGALCMRHNALQALSEAPVARGKNRAVCIERHMGVKVPLKVFSASSAARGRPAARKSDGLP